MSITTMNPRIIHNRIAGKEPLKPRLISGTRGTILTTNSSNNNNTTTTTISSNTTRFIFGLSGSRNSSTFQLSTLRLANIISNTNHHSSSIQSLNSNATISTSNHLRFQAGGIFRIFLLFSLLPFFSPFPSQSRL